MTSRTGSDELVSRIADRLVDQSGEPWPNGTESDRLHYWRDKAIKASRDLRALNAIATPDTDRVAVLTEALREARRFVEEQSSSHPRSSLLHKIDAIIRQGAGK